MNDEIKFINGWLALGWAVVVGNECFKLATVESSIPGSISGMLALIVVCVGLFLVGIYNFVSIAE